MAECGSTNKAYAATPAGDLRQQIMDCRVPKNEREHWAARAISDLLEAGRNALVGGNHLALLIGGDHPPYSAEPLDALEHYGACDTYEVWCAWRSLMRLRDAMDQVAPTPGVTAPIEED